MITLMARCPPVSLTYSFVTVVVTAQPAYRSNSFSVLSRHFCYGPAPTRPASPNAQVWQILSFHIYKTSPLELASCELGLQRSPLMTQNPVLSKQIFRVNSKFLRLFLRYLHIHLTPHGKDDLPMFSYKFYYLP